MTDAATLRGKAAAATGGMPPLLARARHLSANLVLGAHGRRRAGTGDEFWQFRPAHSGDPAHKIDWRRSARFEAHFIRETEWQAAQNIYFWCDRSEAMQFRSHPSLDTKADRAAVLSLALGVLLVRAGERVGLLSPDLPPRSGDFQLSEIAQRLLGTHPSDYGAPPTESLRSHARVVFLSDFLGDLSQITAALNVAVEKGISGTLVQILDPQEEHFPFVGRTIFETRSRSLSFETRKAASLRESYLSLLADRKNALREICGRAGWQFFTHHTDASAQKALLWLYSAMENAY